MHQHSLLQVFTAAHCSSCIEIHKIAPIIRKEFPHIGVIIIDIDDPQAVIPEIVFATPTYLLDGRVVSMGNPSLQELRTILSGCVVDVC